MRSTFFIGALAAALTLACFTSPFASKLPDGLDKFAQDHGVENRATVIWEKAPLPEYSIRLVSNPSISTGIAGGIGTLVVFGLLCLGGRMLASRGDSEVKES